jgi:arginine utilization protein RocB
MTSKPDRAQGIALAERLIALPSVSPDPTGEKACAAAIRAALPKGMECGEWPTSDGRPVVWGLLRGSSPRALVLLTHYDTVGVDEFAALGGPEGAGTAFRSALVRERLLALDQGALPAALRADLEEERRAPGTWLFGRGALDMKSGIAAGLVALHSLASGPGPLPGSVLFVSCPDEENQSAGMLRAVPELAAMRSHVDFRGALSLDYVEAPLAFDGVVGKLLVGLYVLGVPTHAGNPFGGADAVQLAAAVVSRLTTSDALCERALGGMPPVALGMRDTKSRYDVQTALEVEVELNLVTYQRPLGRTMEMLRTELASAFGDVATRMAQLAVSVGRVAPTWPPADSGVLLYPELVERAGGASADDAVALGAGTDPRSATWERVRRLVRRAGLVGPAVVIVLLPPYYPASAPRPGGLGERLRPLLTRRGLSLDPYYRYISDASYVAWRGDPPRDVSALLPALGREYRLPVNECRVLDLDVVTLGPWGRDAHGLFERVDTRFAFETLPELIVDATLEVMRSED